MSEDHARFEGRVVLVTGSGRGLGREVALLIAEQGARVVVADNGTAMDGGRGADEPAIATVADITLAGGHAVSCLADLSTESGAQLAVETALGTFGKIDAIVHGASTCPDLTTADAISSADLELVFRINPMAGLWLARAAWPHMAARNFGRIVYMTSGGIYGSLGNAPYAAAKSAYIGMTRCLAVEGEKLGIMVNAVAPAARSRMTERFAPSPYASWFLRTMDPRRAAYGIAWLASAECSLQGQILAVGGNRIARISLAETEGLCQIGETIGDVEAAIPAVMEDATHFYPEDLSARSSKAAGLMGFEGKLEANDKFAVRPIAQS